MNSTVLKIFSKILKIRNISKNKKYTIKNTNNWDSLAHINLMMNLEKEFKIKFSLDEVSKIKDINSIIKIIKRKKSEL
jgi:acyl carrier protein